jgi:phosphatidate cytidylyltransferase
MSFAGIDQRVLIVTVAVYAILAAATLIVVILGRRGEGRRYDELAARVRSWWIMIGIFSIALLLGRIGMLIFLGLVSFLAFKEYLSLIPTRRADRVVLLFAYLAIPAQFYWVGIDWYGMFVIFIPVYMFLLLPLPMLLVGETHGFLKAIGTLNWGLMTAVFSLSHAAYLMTLPANGNSTGGAGLLVFLILLTEANDVAQFVWGKLLGRHKIIPRVSPNKTWEGFIGGLATTTILSILLGPVLTPMDPMMAALVGLLIGGAGFVGDVTISAVKRDLGVKDSGALIPGHGGVLDRLDSLTYTAPLFFHFVRYFYY